ncbi:MAG TPA: hypothetical protein VMS86_00675 [Thermoanaerobaculia bacterium]|nr:hypothetical protein [Thermoanaerobaculia bacterium]
MRIWREGRELELREIALPIVSRAAGCPLEIEIGFGKGRFLVAQAAARQGTRFLGIESAPTYWRLASRRAARRGLLNLVTVCGDALYVLAACLERGCASTVHIYFPDPWPKIRHRRRRLLDEGTVDLVLGALEPGGVLYFATDHVDYGEAVRDVLARHPGVSVECVEGPWPDGPRTNYEVKYQREGRPILRLRVTRRAPAGASMLHPDGVAEVAAGWAPEGHRSAPPAAEPGTEPWARTCLAW